MRQPLPVYRGVFMSRYSFPVFIAAALLALVLFTVLIHTALAGNHLGADFFTFWVAGKAFFSEQTNPYSETVTLQSQMGIYGRPALPEEDQVAFAYPLYSLLAVLPASLMPYDWAISFWLALNILVLVSILYWIFPAKAKPFSLSVLLLYPVFFGLVMGNFAVFVGIAILFFFGVIVQGQNRGHAAQIASALLLAWATAKPQFVWIYLIFILVITVRQRLWTFLAALAGFGFLFAGFAFAVLPGWLLQWIQRVQEYAVYVQGRPSAVQLLRAVVPDTAAVILGWFVMAAAFATTLLLMRRWWQGKTHWLPTAAWAGLTTFLIHPHGISYEQITFLIPVILWVSQRPSWRSPELLFFWIGTLVISWLPFFSGIRTEAVDRSPVLFNAVWVVWLTLYASKNAAEAVSPPALKEEIPI